MGARILTYKGEKLPYPHYRQKICALFELSAQEMGLYTEALEETNETAPILSTPWQEIPAQKQDSHTDKQLFHPRRRFLMGLGGIGAITLLLGGAWMLTPHVSSISSTSSTRFKLLARLIDPNNTNWINNLTWSPDGKMLAVANNIPMVTTWNVAKGVLTDHYPTSSQWVNDVTWSRTNWIAATAANVLHSTGAIQIWTSSAADNPVLTLLHRAYAQRTVSWSPDREYLTFAGHQTIVEIRGPIGNPVSHYLHTDQKVWELIVSNGLLMQPFWLRLLIVEPSMYGKQPHAI